MFETHHKINRIVPGKTANALHRDLLTLNCKTLQNYAQWQHTSLLQNRILAPKQKQNTMFKRFAKRNVQSKMISTTK
jgi:hypothetical protein